MRLIFAATLFAFAAACAPSTPVAPTFTAEQVKTESEGLTKFLDEQYGQELAMSPMSLTQNSSKDQYDKLDDFSEGEVQKELDWRRKSVADMKAKFDPAKLDEDAKTSWDMWALELERRELQSKWLRWALVFGYGGPHTDVPSFMISLHKVDVPADMDAYIARLGEVGRFMDQALERAKLAAADGIRAPKFGYDRTIGEASSIISGAPFGKGEDSPLWADVVEKSEALQKAGKATADQVKGWQDAAKKELLGKVGPSYTRLIAWLKDDEKNAATGKVGAQTLPKGAEWYAASLELLTTTKMTPKEIHALGLSEVKRIQTEMDKIRVATGFKGDAKQFFEFMRTDPQFYMSNDDKGRAEYLAKAQGYLDAMYKKLPEYFGRLPQAKLVVKREPAFSEVAGGAAHYNRATPDGKEPGTFYAHLSDMKAVSVWALESLAYHEGVPGHHLQIAIQSELKDIPQFRTQYIYGAYVEGWGLYAEGLGKTMGFFTDPYNDFGRLSSELWRATRLVLDTGIHDLGWTEDEAVKWAMENTPRPETAIKSEVKRFVLWPGQATTYKIGQLTIERLRDEAKTALGDKFKLSDFHDVVVGGGSMPLPVLETRVRDWIKKVKG